jgi:hypothetical protein
MYLPSEIAPKEKPQRITLSVEEEVEEEEEEEEEEAGSSVTLRIQSSISSKSSKL